MKPPARLPGVLCVPCGRTVAPWSLLPALIRVWIAAQYWFQSLFPNGNITFLSSHILSGAFMRRDARAPDAMREVRIELDYTKHAEGSALIMIGDTRVLCTCSIEDKVPPFLFQANQGWVTAEYGMVPRSTNTRTPREAARGKQSGRTVEIQRLIGRSLRSVANLSLLGKRSLLIDCDVIQADGGTRTASITGGFLALALAVNRLLDRKLLEFSPLADFVAATSVGIIGDTPCLDLNYEEDSSAAVDMNLVMTGGGRFVELQGTAEKQPFNSAQLQALLGLGAQGIEALIQAQKTALAARGIDIPRLICPR